MTRLLVSTAAFVLVNTALSGTQAAAQTAKDVVGTYMFVSETREKDGTTTEIHSKGILVLDATGHYVLTIHGLNLPKIASNNRTTATPDEAKAIVAGTIAHFGTYSVNDNTLIFKIESATFPNWNGAEQKRPFTLTGDDLRYTLAVASGGGSVTINWKRVK